MAVQAERSLLRSGEQMEKADGPSGAPSFSGIRVRDLIDALKAHDPEAPVVLTGREGGFSDVLGVQPIPLKLHVNTMQGFGPHDVPGPRQRHDAIALALVGAPLPGLD
jgi:hypothetical protein